MTKIEGPEVPTKDTKMKMGLDCLPTRKDTFFLEQDMKKGHLSVNKGSSYHCLLTSNKHCRTNSIHGKHTIHELPWNNIDINTVKTDYLEQIMTEIIST